MRATSRDQFAHDRQHTEYRDLEILFMIDLRIAVSLVFLATSQAVAQGIGPADAAAIERAAVEYVSKSLPKGDIGIDPDITRAKQRIARDSTQVQALTRALGARVVHADSVFTCGKDPSTCKLDVAALVRVGEPVATEDGARVWVEVRRHSGFARQPVVTGLKELVLTKKAGAWTVVRVAGRNVS
jgi:hypothetical protein